MVAQTGQGFTLSELLISLAVLGLIAALTLPSIFNSVAQNQMKAVERELLTSVAQVVTEGLQSGTIATTGAGFREALIQKLNPSRVCNTDFVTQGCGVERGGLTWAGTNPGIVLHNGTQLVFGTNSIQGCGDSIYMLFDANGNSGPNIQYKDIDSMRIRIAGLQPGKITLSYGCDDQPTDQQRMNELYSILNNLRLFSKDVLNGFVEG
ncbi:MAG: Tfp pilus assembly protein FimT/FimU [Vampirovibrionales bacterium]